MGTTQIVRSWTVLNMEADMTSKVDIITTDVEDVDKVDVEMDADTDAVVTAEVTVEDMDRTSKIDGTRSPVTIVGKSVTSVGSVKTPVVDHTEWQTTPRLTPQGWMNTLWGDHHTVMNLGNSLSTTVQSKNGVENAVHGMTTSEKITH